MRHNKGDSMENIWTRANDKVPQYFEFIAQRYDFKFIKISSLKTAIIGNKFAIIIAIERFYVDVYYAIRIEDKKEIFHCGSFLAEKYSSEDRKNLLTEDGAENLILNNLKVIASGLVSKWEMLLLGDINWLDEFRKSKWYSTVDFSYDECNILWMFI